MGAPSNLGIDSFPDLISHFDFAGSAVLKQLGWYFSFVFYIYLYFVFFIFEVIFIVMLFSFVGSSPFHGLSSWESELKHI